MNGGETEALLARIEAALHRIETAASRPAASLADLQSRHDALREAVSLSLGRLDDLIAEQAE